MKNVEWVEVQPFHQLGAFKWKAMKLEYKCANTATAAPDLVNWVIEQFELRVAALGDAFVQGSHSFRGDVAMLGFVYWTIHRKVAG